MRGRRFWNHFNRRPRATGPLKLNEKYADCDWHKDSNRQEHHTDEFIRTDDALVVRRGQPVKFTARLNRPFDTKKDDVQISLRFGANPSTYDGTHVIIGKKTSESQEWFLTVDEASGNNVQCSIHTAPNALIGRYKCAIYLETGGNRVVDEEPDIILLCNPWCQDDDVYLSDENERQEYVLNDQGYIWRGDKNRSTPCTWNFGQFEDKILDVCLGLLMRDKRVLASRGYRELGDAVWLSRIISATANSSDDNGILTGNWSGNYEGGKSPVTWNGSVKIIQQYADQGNTPVKFGQCWVFSGVATTLLRAIGIPARSVTNFASAHDTNNTMTIDTYVNKENDEEIKLSRNDSVWNFHVWNEVFLKGQGHWDEKYSGWAAVDATPQERSKNMMQCGPVPIKAIKEGEVWVGYDGHFVFGEVNADSITWICKETYSSVQIDQMGSRKMRDVGFNISTKAVGSWSRQLLTDAYKYPEGSDQERAAWKNAYQNSSRPHYFNSFLEVDKETIKIDISLTPEIPQNGEDVTISVDVTNLKSSDVTIDVKSKLYSCFYTGVKKSWIKGSHYESQHISGNETKSFPFTVPFDLYQNRFADDQMSMKAETLVTIHETQKQFTDALDFQMFNNDEAVTIKFDAAKGRVGQPLTAQISFTNPLPLELTEIEITLEGSGLVAPTTQKLGGSIPARGTANIQLTLIPSRIGHRNLLVDIDTKQQKDFKCAKSIEITT